MAAAKTSDDLFLHFLQDIYYAERQILKALPKMAKIAHSPELKQALTHHREETQHQIENLQKVFEAIGKRVKGQTCEAINGILEEGEEAIEEFGPGVLLDAAMVANAQAVEHYEMARYGALIAWAQAKGEETIVTLLTEILEQEKNADKILTELAGASINEAAITLKAA